MSTSSIAASPSRGNGHRLVRSLLSAFIAAPLLSAAPVLAEDEDAIGFEKTPPRLSLVDGEASFWRPGAEEWTQAQVNTPLAAGDQLYASAGANLELQIGTRAYVRAGGETQLGFYAIEPDYLQLRLTEGDLSLDLRSLKAGQTLEVDTPNAAFTVEHTGYYRVVVDGQDSTFISRRGGRALVTPASGTSSTLGAGEQLVVRGLDAPIVASYAAPDLDSWDRWNYARTDHQIQSASGRYVSSEVYGLADLDAHGEWRQVPAYGAVWVPRVAVGWVPYSTGRWLYDPFYGWSWVDDAPWGWAPFHYGRWVHVSGFWGWCPGPIVVRPYYAPALVAFFGGPRISVSVGAGLPFGWVALGWGEPLTPWWGPVRFRRSPCWAGWGGPHVVNRVVIKNKTVVHVANIRDYENTRVRHGVVVVDRDSFGRRRIDSRERRRYDAGDLRPVHGDLPFRPDREGYQSGERGRRPPREVLDRRVVSTREPRAPRGRDAGNVRGQRRADTQLARLSPPPRIVQPTREARRAPGSSRPAVGRGDESSAPPPVPRANGSQRSERRTVRRGDVAAPPSRQGRVLTDPSAPATRQQRRASAPPPVPGSVRADNGGRGVRPRRSIDPPGGGAGDRSAAPRSLSAPPNRAARERPRAEPVARPRSAGAYPGPGSRAQQGSPPPRPRGGSPAGAVRSQPRGSRGGSPAGAVRSQPRGSRGGSPAGAVRSQPRGSRSGSSLYGGGSSPRAMRGPRGGGAGPARRSAGSDPG